LKILSHSSTAMLAALITSGAAYAQAPSQPAAGQLEEVVITAQRRSESLQDTPLAVSAFSSETLQSKQIVDTYDLVRNVPNLAGNLNVGVGTSTSYYMRGLGNGESIATFDVPVGTYVDDVYIARQNANNFALFDVERIEVLRGPQGTLFGRNTTGGAINIIMKKPSDTFQGYIEGGYGRFEKWSLRASVDAPFNEKVLTKLSLFRVKDDGYATQVSTGRQFNSQNSWGMRGEVRLLPTENLTIDLTAEYIDDQNTNFLNVEGPGGDRIVNNRIQEGALIGLVTGDKGTLPLDNQAQSASYAANIAWDLGPATLTSITAYRKTDQEYMIDSGGELPRVTTTRGFNPLLNIGEHIQYSQEFKLDGLALEDRLTYVVGLFALKEENTTDFANGATTAATGAFNITADRTLKNDLTTYAVYGQLDYDLTERLTLTAGTRYTYEEKTFAVQTNPGGRGAVLSTAAMRAAGLPTVLEEKQWTPRFAASYDISDAVMVFASATRGFKSGGWPARAIASNLFIPFLPETIWSYETGVRADLFDRTLRMNVTAFYADTQDIQIPAQVAGPTGPVSTTSNPAGLRNYGLELEATWLPTDRLTLDLSVGLQNAEYVDIAANVQAQQARCRAGIVVANLPGCNANFVDQRGNIAEPLRAPDTTVAASASYKFDFAFGSITPNVSVNYTSAYAIGTNGSPTNTDGSWTEEQTLWNAGVTFRPAAFPTLTVTAECKNCTDEAYAVSYIPVFQFLDRPGAWMVRARYAF
jgi:iron complex outermembrane recepter protein